MSNQKKHFTNQMLPTFSFKASWQPSYPVLPADPFDKKKLK